MKYLCSILSLIFVSVFAKAEPPEITIVTGPNAGSDSLETYAASELKAQLEKLFQAKVSVVQKKTGDEEKVILLGSPQSNPAIPKTDWPASISDQGQVLKSTGNGLILGGGSPVATLWAVYELGHSFGMRYLLHGDYPPIDPPEFSLAGFDTILEPGVKIRGWRTIDSGAAGPESWGLADQQKLLKQLAKLKFNAVILVLHKGQPYRDFEAGGKGLLWGGEEFPVSGETAGRSVFEGAKLFENPDFAGKTGESDRAAAALRLMKGIRNTARDLGMSVAVERDGSGGDPGISVLSLGQAKGGLLPHFSCGKLPGLLARAGQGKGFAVKGSIPGDLDMDVYYLSRASFDSKLSPGETLESLVTPICGDGVGARLANGFAAIEEAVALIEKEDPDFVVPAADMFMKHYQSGAPFPEWWGKAKEHFGTAVNEMYRGNTRARGGARPFILYHAKRFTFALHYMTAVEHARLAGMARKEKNNGAWSENLELSVEAMHNALGIYADVARDNSDRGVIAVLNKYAYRPLLSALDEAPLP